MMESQAKGLIREKRWVRSEVICTVHEGLGRANSLLSSREAAAKSFAHLQESLSAYLALPVERKEHFRQMQLCRSILEVQERFNTLDHGYDQFIDEAVTVGRTFNNMPRHLAKVEFMLSKINN
jgi:hypothetical protein